MQQYHKIRVFVSFILLNLVFSYTVQAGVPRTYVPDDNFEEALIALGYDDVLDDYVDTDNINTVTYLSVQSKGIADLTGIEDFAALETFRCNSNPLTSLDVSKNTELTFLGCVFSQLTSLDVSKNTKLDSLYCYKNQLTSLDVSANTELKMLACFDNQLTDLDVSTNTNLTNLFCISNPDLDCIQVNATQLSAIPTDWVKDAAASYSIDCTKPFITTWRTTTANESITIPTSDGTSGYDFTVDWGDGTIETVVDAGDPDPSHIYATAGDYQVVISGQFPRIHFNNQGDKNKIRSVDQWGDIAWTDMTSAFKGCENLHIYATDAPDLSLVTRTSNMFAGASVMNEDIGHWEVGTIERMDKMFKDASEFNQPLNNWDVSHVKEMYQMFSGASSFNQDIGGWDVSNVEKINNIFFRATSFNQNLCGWDISSATNLRGMFIEATSFNQDLSCWDVSHIQGMVLMFYYATSFDQDLGSWDVGNVTDMNLMLGGTAMSTCNYDQTLIGWSGNGYPARLLGAEGIEYCASTAARQSLIDDGWTFSGDVACTPLAITGVSSSQATCANGSDGSITVTASGGAAPLVYSLDGGATFQSGNSFTSLSAGSYDLVVRDGDNACLVFSEVAQMEVITAPSQLEVTAITPTAITTCPGAADGSIEIMASGGTAPLSYSIDNGVNFQASNAFTGLAAGNYQIVVEGVNGCATSYLVAQSQTINELAALEVTAITPTDISCFGAADGSIEITASGGTAPLSYSIDNGGSFQVANTFTGLLAGNYEIVVEDANGCTASYLVSQNQTINEPTALEVAAITAIAITTCPGAANGSIEIMASGGTAPLSYSIDNGVSFQASNAFTGLVAGNYEIVVEDGNGCTASYLVSQNQTINEPAALEVTAITSTAITTCQGAADGTLEIMANGGTAPLSYSIDNGVNFQASNAFTGLMADDYQIVVEDQNNCTANYLVAQSQTINESAALEVTAITPTDISCFGAADGSIEIMGSGGTVPLSYSIDNGVTFQASNAFTGLVAGNYEIVVEDGNGCPVNYLTNTVAEIKQPVQLLVTDIEYTDVSCANSEDGTISITMMEGYSPEVMYSIDGGRRFQNSPDFQGLSTGTYQVSVTGGDGCLADYGELETQLTVDAETTSIESSATAPYYDDIDSQWLIDLSVSGGTAPYEAQLTKDGEIISFSLAEQESAQIGELEAGSNLIEVFDVNGCQVDFSVWVESLAVLAEKLELSNALSPNGDGINDVLKINNMPGSVSSNLTVFNRYGQQVYAQSDYNNDWAGDGLPEGVYYYVLALVDQSIKGYFEIQY